MDYTEIYTKNYFSGEDSFFYRFGYGRFQRIYFYNLFKPLKPYVRAMKHGKVLDVGCAYGFMLEKISDTFEKFGMDVSDYALAKARQRLPRGVFIMGGAEDVFPFPKNFFDIVLCTDVLEHLENPGAALARMRTVLKPGGVLYITTPNLNWFRRNILAHADSREHHISLLSHTALSDLLTTAGFCIVDHWTYMSLTFGFLPSVRFHSSIGDESAFLCSM